MVLESDRTFLGLDLSTQQLKGVVVNDNLEIICEEKVVFDTDLPEFRTQGGVNVNNVCIYKTQEDDTSSTQSIFIEEITAPTIMWVKALDMLMDRLMIAHVDFSKIAAVSGTAQQHGSVYWQTGAAHTLKKLDPTKFLHEQLAMSFSINDSPVWMDSSTTEECKDLENAVGGPERLAELTGSKGYERFTGPQIAKIVKNKPDAYKNTERIQLVSNFLASIFTGTYAPIDYADGSGMNLMDIRTKKWDKRLLDVCAPDLEDKLGQTVVSNTILGRISCYFIERYGFKRDCKIVAFTGDNPASLIGMRLNEGWLAVSLGTSDTLFLWVTEPKTTLDGHLLCNPVDPKAYMAMLCFKNGSLTRERIRNTYASKDWDKFNELLDSTPRGNFGNIGLYYDSQEILPFVSPGEVRYNKAGEKLCKFASPEIDIRAVLEGQFLSRRVYSEELGLRVGKGTKILATGGASNNKAILQVLSDCFNSPVYLLETANSAMMGAAYQAKHGLVGDSMNYVQITSCLPPPQLACTPFPDSADIYGPMTKRLRALLKRKIVNIDTCQ